MPRATLSLDDLVEILGRLDTTADDAAWLAKNLVCLEAETGLEQALDRLGERWRGDEVEFAARRAWLRSEITRRLAKVGGA